jgi:ribonucleoside-triphosphate reductase
MRNLEAIDRDLAAARESLSSMEGTPTEVYSRIVGYYRSVRNWNKGKREEYGERRLYNIDKERNGERIEKNVDVVSAALSPPSSASRQEKATAIKAAAKPVLGQTRILLFARASCPNCIPAKAAAAKLGIPVTLVNADTKDGLAEAQRRGVMSTPTAILISPNGEEIRRSSDVDTIARFFEPIAV